MIYDFKQFNNNLYMKKLFYLTLIFTSIVLVSCENDIITENPVINVPETFNFKTVKSIDYSVIVNDTYNGTYFYKVEVFDRHPFATDTVANLLQAGVAKADMIFNSKLALPLHVNTVYVRQTDPLNRQTVKAFDVSNEKNTFSFDFRPTSTSVAGSPKRILSQPSENEQKATDYSLPSNYITLNSDAITLNGSNYYIPAGVVQKNLTYGWMSNSALYVAGELIFNNEAETYLPQNSKLVLLPGSKVTFNVPVNFAQQNVIVAVHPTAVLILNGTSAIGAGGKIITDGKTVLANDFEIRQNSSIINNNILNGTKLTQTNQSNFVNNGIYELSSGLVMNSNTTFTNNGVFEAKNYIRANNTTAVITNYNKITTLYWDMSQGGGKLDNYCRVITEDMKLDGAFIYSETGSYITAQDFYANNTEILLKGNAIFDISNTNSNQSNELTGGAVFNWGVTIKGVMNAKDYPLVNISKLKVKTGWQVLDLQGNMQVVIPAGEFPTANFFKAMSNGVEMVNAPTLTIAASSCNGSGINEDDGDNNPSNPDFPMVVNENNEYTFAMEDMWPYLGDYDVNDFVFKVHNISKTLSSQNLVSSMQFSITPLGAGSIRQMSAALQFDDLAAESVSVSSTSNIASVETGHEKSNIILFPTVHTLFGKSSPVITNTYNQVAKVPTTTYTFTVNFSSAVAQDKLNIDRLNFYMIVGESNSNNRNEVHLAGFSPSSKVQKPTNNYKDENNMMWAIMLPVGNFKYPTEKTKIYDAYPKFNTWVSSMAQNDKDWYLKPSSDQSRTYNK